MATATALSHARMRSLISCCMCFSFFAAFVATVNQPSLVKADSSPPSTIELYFLLPGTIAVSAAPSGNASEFGSIFVFNNLARLGPGEDSTVVGKIVGQVSVAMDGSQYVDFTYMLSLLGGYADSALGQGISDLVGNGESAITGGTGAFRSISGYFEILVLTPAVLLKSILHIDYP